MPDLDAVLQRIADSPAAMSALDAIVAEDARPPKVDEHGVLVMRDAHTAEDPGAPARSLGDLVREALNLQ